MEQWEKIQMIRKSQRDRRNKESEKHEWISNKPRTFQSATEKGVKHTRNEVVKVVDDMEDVGEHAVEIGVKNVRDLHSDCESSDSCAVPLTKRPRLDNMQ